MKTKRIIIMAAMLLILIGLRLIQVGQKENRFKEPVLNHMFPVLSLDQVGSFTISAPNGVNIDIRRRADHWIVASKYGHRAKTENLERLVAGLSGLKGEFRSDDPAVLADYSLDDAGAITLRLSGLAEETLGEVLLGKAVSSRGGCFARQVDAREVYAVEGNVLGSLGIWGDDRDPKVSFFLDLQAMKVDRGEIDAVTLEHEGAMLHLVKVFEPSPADTIPVDRTQYDWRLGDTELDKAKADAVAGALATIHARDIIDPSGAYDFNSSGMRATLQLADGTSRVVEFGRVIDEPERGVTMRILDDRSLYLAQENLPERVFKSRDDLLPAPPESDE